MIKVLKYSCCFFSMLVLFGCDQKNGPAEEQTQNAPALLDNEAVLYLVDDYWANPFEFGNPTIANIRDQMGGDIVLDKQPFQNRNNPAQIDTVVTLKIDASKFVFYKGVDYEIFYYASVQDDRIKFERNIYIGCSKKHFANQFKEIKGKFELPDVIQVGNAERLDIFNFIFQNERLATVIYDGNID